MHVVIVGSAIGSATGFKLRSDLSGKTGGVHSHDFWVRQKPCQAR